MHCSRFTDGSCRSCSWLELPYAEQLQRKQAALQESLQGLDEQCQWLDPVASDEQHFRGRAKMVVSGNADEPVLGILGDGRGVDLTACPLYPPELSAAFEPLRRFIQRNRLTPYQVNARQGELKYLLVNRTEADGSLLLRFVLRTPKLIQRIANDLPWLQRQLPQLKVVSVNLQPLHAAILEGPEEILLTEQESVCERLNDVPLYLHPRSFFQTHPALAARLYATAAQWSADYPRQRIWDLFCGVGGFGLHCAQPDSVLTGIEIAPEAIASAERSAREMGLQQVEFHSLDATVFAQSKQLAPDLLLVNPPRRGLGEALCQQIEQLAPQTLIYSSCNAQTLQRDLAQLSHYRLRRAQLFDLFPHTHHYETLVLLERQHDTAE